MAHFTPNTINSTRVRVNLTHNNSGAARMVVHHNGRQKSIPFNYGASNPWADAALAAFGIKPRSTDWDTDTEWRKCGPKARIIIITPAR